jgi:hypothetical protein
MERKILRASAVSIRPPAARADGTFRSPNTLRLRSPFAVPTSDVYALAQMNSSSWRSERSGGQAKNSAFSNMVYSGGPQLGKEGQNLLQSPGLRKRGAGSRRSDSISPPTFELSTPGFATESASLASRPFALLGAEGQDSAAEVPS